jgi:hypothetical protein
VAELEQSRGGVGRAGRVQRLLKEALRKRAHALAVGICRHGLFSDKEREGETEKHTKKKKKCV